MTESSSQSNVRFNPPPNWPRPPLGWRPPQGWAPDPAWGPPPPGWVLWTPIQPEPSADHPPNGHMTRAGLVLPSLPSPTPATGGTKNRYRTLTGDYARLREWANQVMALDPFQVISEAENVRASLAEESERVRTELAAETGRVRGDLAAETERTRAALAEESERAERELADLHAQTEGMRAKLAELREQVVTTDEAFLLQEAGMYEYQHPLGNVVSYKARLATVKDTMKAMVRAGDAILTPVPWTVNGSARSGAKMLRDHSRLMLRAYNTEADNLVRTMRPHRLDSSIERLDKSREMITRLGKTESISISDDYHRLRVEELELTADYQNKLEEEKELARAERERQREEQSAQREFEREKARLEKERQHYRSALDRVEARGDAAKVEELRSKLDEVETAIDGVERREANTRAGYVYIISNVGAFGEHMVKIGMTRRLAPEDRIRELGDASVPFRFDAHALIFSEDAVGLETRLHHELDERRVNRVNLRREFFYATPAEVREVLEQIGGQHLIEYTELPEAAEWRASRGHH